MKTKVLAMVLAICMVFAMLPATVFAAMPKQALTPSGTPELLALPEAPAETNGAYSITKTVTGPGVVQSSPSSSANAGDEVLLMANPNPGYETLVDDHGLNLDFMYIGFDMYVFTMPARNVTLDFYFEPVSGASYSISVNAPDGCSWYLMDGVTSAKPTESVYLVVFEDESFSFDPETAVSANCENLYYLGTLDDEGTEHVYELWMPNHNVTIDIEGNAADQIGNQYWKDTIALGETKTITIPRPAYAVDENLVYFTQEFTFVPEQDGIYRFLVSYEEDNSNPYDFTMDMAGAYLQVENGIEFEGQAGESYELYFQYPNHDGRYPKFTFCVVTYNPVTVTVENGLGGSAFADMSTAMMGDTVTLTCVPEEGYRVARITGVDGLVDNGDGTYTFTMPAKAVDLKVLFLRENNPFVDVNETHYFYDCVLWAAEEGITDGISATEFGPGQPCNRAQVVTFLWRYAGSPKPTSTDNPFTDVPAGSFCEEAVLWALEEGITTGISATKFGPTQTCNRVQVVTFLWRYLGEPETSLTENPFVDVDEGSWYEAPVLWALEKGITTGTDSTHFNPAGECIRAQVVTFLYRTAQLSQEPTEPEEPTKPAKTFELDLRTNGNGEVAYVDGKMTAAPGESIFFYAVPHEGFYLDHVGIFNPDNTIDVSMIQVIEHGNDLYELIMIPFDLIMTCHFYPNP